MVITLQEALLLVPSHNRLRNPHKIQDFVELILKNEDFTKKIAIYQLNCFLGSAPIVHDGHHRVCAWIKLMRDGVVNSIPESAFSRQDVELEWFTIPNPMSGWVTPYNPLTHVRTPNFFQYKEELTQNIHKIENYGHLYKEPRKIHSFKELEGQYA